MTKTKGKIKGEKKLKGKRRLDRGRERVGGRRKGKRKGKGKGKRQEKGKGKRGKRKGRFACSTSDLHRPAPQISLVLPSPAQEQVLEKNKVTCLPVSTGTCSHSHVPRNRLLGPACLHSPMQLSQA